MWLSHLDSYLDSYYLDSYYLDSCLALTQALTVTSSLADC